MSQCKVQTIFTKDSARVKCLDFHPTQPLLLISLYSGEALIFDVIGRERYNLSNAKKLKYLSWSEETGEGKVSTWRTRYDRVKKVCSTFVQDGKYHAITLNYEGDINQNLKDHKLDEKLIWASTKNNWENGHVKW